MAKASFGPGSDHEFIRAYQVELRELENAHPVAVCVTIVAGTQRGVLAFRHEVFLPASGGTQERLCAYTCEWPNVTTQSLAAALYNGAVRLRRLVDDGLMDFERAVAPRQRG